MNAESYHEAYRLISHSGRPAVKAEARVLELNMPEALDVFERWQQNEFSVMVGLGVIEELAQIERSGIMGRIDCVSSKGSYNPGLRFPDYYTGFGLEIRSEVSKRGYQSHRIWVGRTVDGLMYGFRIEGAQTNRLVTMGFGQVSSLAGKLTDTKPVLFERQRDGILVARRDIGA